MKRKIFSIITALALCLSLCPTWALAAEATVTMDGTDYSYGGDAIEMDYLNLDEVKMPTYYTAETGKIYYKPDLLTLENVEIEDGLQGIFKMDGLQVEVMGDNHIPVIQCMGNLTLTGSGSLTAEGIGGSEFTDTGFTGTLNSLVMVMEMPEEEPNLMHYTVYGTVTLQWDMNAGPETALTVRSGAELIIPKDCTLFISDLDCFENKGTIVNNGVIDLTEADVGSDPSQTISGLHLTGSGKVQAGEDFYTNGGELICRHSFGDWDENNERECTICHEKETAAVKVVMGGTTAYYAGDLADAFTKEYTAAAVTLLADVELAGGIEIKSGDVTLDLAGHTIGCYNGDTALYIDGNTNLTIRDSGGSGGIESKGIAINIDGSAAVTLSGGRISSVNRDNNSIYARNGTLIVDSEDVSIHNLTAYSDANVELSAGRYTGQIYQGGSLGVRSFLLNRYSSGDVTRYAYYDADDKPIALGTEGRLTGPVTVKECNHSGGFTDNGDGTHRVNCGACGKSSNDRIAHTYDGDTGLCVCGAKAPVTITTQPESADIFFGKPHTLRVTTDTTDAVTYQWYENGTAIEGATEPSYTVEKGVGSYQYYCIVTAGDYAVKSKTATVTVSQSGTEFTGGVKAYKDDTETDSFLIGDAITVKATPAATGAAPANAVMMMASLDEPAAGFMAVYYDGQQVSAPSTVENGVHTMTVDTNDLPPEAMNKEIPLAVKYIGDGNLASAEDSVKVTVTAEAQVTAGGANTYYATFEEAWNAALAAKTATITLLADVESSAQLEILDTSAHITLDGNGHTFNSNYSGTYLQFRIFSGKLTFRDCTIISRTNQRLVENDGQLELQRSTIQSNTGGRAMTEIDGELTMDADSIFIGTVNFRNNPQQLSIGRFEDAMGSKPLMLDLDVDGKPLTPGNLLKNYGDSDTDEHYAYFDEDDQPILDILELEQLPQKKYTVVTIGACTDHVWKYEPIANTSQHTKTCRACGYSEHEDCTYTFNGDTGTCQKCEGTITVSLAADNLTYTGSEIKPAVTVTMGSVTMDPNDYTVAYDKNTNVGTASVTVTLNNNRGTWTGMFDIGKATPDTSGIAAALVYGQKLSDSVVTGNAVNPNQGTVTVPGQLTWDSPNAQPTGEGIELYTGTFTPNDTDNYTTARISPTVTVKPDFPRLSLSVPAYQVADEDVSVTYTVENSSDANLKNGLPEVTLTWKIGDGEEQPITDGKFHIPAGTAVGTVITVKAAATEVAGKYREADISEEVTVTDKIPVEISGVTAEPAVYDGKPHKGYTGTPVVKTMDGEAVTDAELTYTWNQGDNEAPVNADSYLLEIAVNDGTYIGKTTISFIISPATITIQADDQRADVGGAKPELTYTVDGLVGGDTLATAPTLTCDADMDATGEYPITASGAAVPGGGNYNTEITYVPGMLTVTDPTIHVTGVTLNKASMTLTVGGSERLAATVAPSDATDKSVTWTSSDTAVATVDASGNVTAVSAGAATITVTTDDGSKTATCEVTVKAEEVPPATIAVTGVTLNKAGMTLTVGGSERLTATVAPSDATDKSVTWTSSDTAVATVDASGNVTAVSAGAATITVTTADGDKSAACTVTVRTNSDSTGGGATGGGTTGGGTTGGGTTGGGTTGGGSTGSGTTGGGTTGSGTTGGSSGTSSGGSTAGTSLPVSTTGQNSATVTTTTTAAPTASTQGSTATTAVNATTGDEIVKQAVANKSEDVVIAPEVTGNVTKTEVSIPASTVGQIGSQTDASLTVSTPVAEVTIPNDGLGSLSDAGGTVTVTAEQTGNTVELTITAGGKTVESIPRGVTVTVPVSDTAPGTVAVLVHEDGTREVVRKSVTGDGSITIPLDGSAKLAIVDNSRQFSDVPADSWMNDAVAFASAHELFNGTGGNQFSPDQPMTRGMLAVVLHNLENNPEQPLSGAFGDVDSDKWYAEGIAWAAANGIVGGYGNGQFGPNDDITREQLAVMLWRYAGSPAATDKELHFTDADEVSDWALEALRWATEKGIINGKGDGILDPAGQATRAEAAQMLKNFLEN